MNWIRHLPLEIVDTYSAMHFNDRYPQHNFRAHSIIEKFILKDSHRLIRRELIYSNTFYRDEYSGRLDDSVVAVKVWRTISYFDKSQEDFLERLSKALTIWSRLCHPNIAPFLGLVEGYGRLPSLVVPYYEGDVTCYLRKNPSTDIAELLRGVAAGLGYLHNSKPPIVHGDVKGSNIIVNEHGQACLSDIGTSALVHRPDWACVHEDSSARWMPPEVLLSDSEPEDTAGDIHAWTPEGEVWCFGMLGLELYSGRVPYAHHRRIPGAILEIYRGITPPRPIKAPQLSDEMWELLTSCWHQDPAQRPNIGLVGLRLQLLNHSFYRG